MAIVTDIQRTEWIGDRPSWLQASANMLIGTIGMIICGVQPVLLGALVAEGRLSAAGLGWATTAEFLTLGVGIIAVGALLKPRNLRLIALIGGVITGSADLAMLAESGNTILINRAISGLGEALMVWVTGCMVARAAAPARWSGVFLTLQGTTQLAFAAIMPLTLMAWHGADGGFIGMAGTALLAIAAVPFLPNSMADLPAHTHTRLDVLASPSAILTLLSVFLIAAFSIGLFVYIAPVAMQAGLSGAQLGFIVSIVLGSSILGSAVAAVVPRIGYYKVFVACLVANAVVLAVLWTLPSFVTFCVMAATFGFMWLFFMPYQLPMAVEVDPTRQLAVMLPGAQLLGGSAGPFFCSFFVTNAESRGALLTVGICFGLAFVISTILHVRVLAHRRQPTLVAPQA